MIRSGLTDSFRVQAMQGAHLAEHEYALVLLHADTSVGPETTKYRTQDEVQGDGYPPGGIPLTGRKVFLEANGDVVIEWKDVTLPSPSLEDVGGALIVNHSLKGASVAVIAFRKPVSANNGPLTVPLARCCVWPRARTG